MSTSATEPVRRNLYPAAVVAALTALLGPLAVVQDYTPQVIIGAILAAIVAFGGVAFGAERARHNVYPAAVVEGDHVEA
jgi:disulfide bond formation protein DsbB